jgi:hypothetical protein
VTNIRLGLNKHAATLSATLHLASILDICLTQIERLATATEYATVVSSLKHRLPSVLIQRAASNEDEVFRLGYHGRRSADATRKTFAALARHNMLLPSLSLSGVPARTLQLYMEIGAERICLEILTRVSFASQSNSIDPRSGYSPVHKAIRTGKPRVFHRLIELGANIDLRGKYHEGDALRSQQSNYLHVCATYNADLSFAHTILNAGVPATLEDGLGTTPLLHAVARLDDKLAWLLLSHGEDLNRALIHGYTIIGQLLRRRFRQNPTDLDTALR